MKLTNKEVQEIVARADDEYDRLKDIVHEQYDEIKRLKEEYIMLQNASDEVEEELQQRIDKAIEKIESVRIYGLRSGKTLITILLNEILDILKGSDKE